MEEMLFPSALSVLSREDIEEERRLFYVAVTRARKYLTLSYALSRYKFGQLNYCEQSRFIDEIKQENIILYGQNKRRVLHKIQIFQSQNLNGINLKLKNKLLLHNNILFQLH